MIRKSSKTYIVVTFALVFVMSLSLSVVDYMRESTISTFAPFYELFTSDNRESLKEDELPLKEEFSLITPFVEAAPAKVIFRSPDSWNSSLWINVGHDNNQDYESVIVAKNSPVVIGDAVIGVIDYVGQKQSRVRLITDSGLVPSVRVARGEKQFLAMQELVGDLIQFINIYPEVVEDEDKKILLEKQLYQLHKNLNDRKSTAYLAKGQLQGLSSAHFRHLTPVLKGSGFNYNFADDYGPARDLRTGDVVNGKSNRILPLVKLQDLLITTGMDGVFPEGLKVAIVSKLYPLKEGDFAYEIEAKPVVQNLNDLTWVHVLAPLGYDEKDVAPIR